MCHYARGQDRGWRYCGRPFCGGQGYSPYTVFGGNPARLIKQRFDEELTGLLLQLCWWDLEPEELVKILPLLCDPDLEKVKKAIKERLTQSP